MFIEPTIGKVIRTRIKEISVIQPQHRKGQTIGMDVGERVVAARLGEKDKRQGRRRAGGRCSSP